jgi:hypothetical protein
LAACQKTALADNEDMSASEIIEQFKGLPANERAQVAKFVVEQDDSWIPKLLKQGMADAAGKKWRGRGQLPVGKNTDEYLSLIRDDHSS